MTEGIVIERKARETDAGVKNAGTADMSQSQGNGGPIQPGSPQNAAGVTEKQEQADTEPSKGSSTAVEQAQKKAGVATNSDALDTTPSSSNKEVRSE